MRYNEAGSCVVYVHIIRICIICVYWIVCTYAYGSCLHTSTHVQCRHVNRSIELWRQCYKCHKRLKMHTQVPMFVVRHGCIHAGCCVYACVYMNMGCGDPITRKIHCAKMLVLRTNSTLCGGFWFISIIIKMQQSMHIWHSLSNANIVLATYLTLIQSSQTVWEGSKMYWSKYVMQNLHNFENHCNVFTVQYKWACTVISTHLQYRAGWYAMAHVYMCHSASSSTAKCHFSQSTKAPAMQFGQLYTNVQWKYCFVAERLGLLTMALEFLWSQLYLLAFTYRE